MSIRALHYITGDTPQSGFRRIGGSDSFPADMLPLLNHGEGIQERARVEAGGNRQRMNSGVQQLSHVWEYQTGRFGVPVVINTIAAIGTGRTHAFSEYVAGMTDNVADIADAGAMIRGAENLTMLSLEEFMQIPGRQEINSPEEVWEPAELDSASEDAQGVPVEETWILTLVSNYWKQASVRAFSENVASPVRVCLGVFDEDSQEADIEETIRRGRVFFWTQITPRLPRQVQNISSMAAGVHCSDRSTLYTALEFDIERDMYADETLQLRSPRELRNYRLNEGEMEFIRLAAEGRIPKAVEEFLARYRELAERQEADELTTPFMADYRVWYGLYCLEQIAEDKNFIMKAGLTREEGNPNKVSYTRACFTLIQNLEKILEEDHHLNDIRRNLVSELMEPLESKVYAVMLADMSQERAEPFLLRRNEMVEFHRKILYQASDAQTEDLIRLAVLDQKKARAPQFVRCYPATPLRNERAEERNGRLLAALLPEVIRPLIDEEKKKGNIENKYLDQLRSEEFADKWAALPQNIKTREAIASFLREEIQDPQKHFLLYKISLKYLPGDELLKTTLKHFSDNHTEPGSKPEERQLKIAAYGAKDYISNSGRVNPECVTAMNQYYFQCFQKYRSNIGAMSDVVAALGGDTTETLRMIFRNGAEGERITPDEAAAAFKTFGGEDYRYAKVKAEYSAMIEGQLEKALEQKDDRVVEWIGGMITAADPVFEFDTTDSLKKIFESAKTGERMRPADAADAFRTMARKASSLDNAVLRSYSDMLAERRKEAVGKQDPEGFGWLCEMTDGSPWTGRRDWIEEQHTENLLALCEICERNDQSIDATTMTTLKGWLEDKTIQQRGIVRLQQYCETELAKDRSHAADALTQGFDRIDESCVRMRDRIFNGVLERFKEGLKKPGASLGALVTECRADTEKAGKKLDDLYSAAREQTDEFLNDYFNEKDLSQLIREQEMIPENTAFSRNWREKVSDQFYKEQVEMFNRQPNMERLVGLKEEIIRRNYRMNSSLKAAYELMDQFENMMFQLGEQTEYEAVTGMDRELQRINDLLGQAAEVRKKLCTTLRSASEDEEKQVSARSFRHALCAAMMRATLTNEERRLPADSRRNRGCPDWSLVLESIFNKAELDEASRKPYAEANLGVLQKLLATVENVRMMVTYGLDESWAEDLVRTIHNDSNLHRYESALARNKKMSLRYQLQFNEDGLQFDLKQF